MFVCTAMAYVASSTPGAVIARNSNVGMSRQSQIASHVYIEGMATSWNECIDQQFTIVLQGSILIHKHYCSNCCNWIVMMHMHQMHLRRLAALMSALANVSV